MNIIKAISFVSIALALFVALAVGANRIAWESERMEITVAVDAGSFVTPDRVMLEAQAWWPNGVLISPAQMELIELFDAGDFVRILNIDRWVSLTEFTAFFENIDSELFDGIYINALVLNSEDHLQIIAKQFLNDNKFLAIDEFESSLSVAKANLELERRLMRTHIIKPDERVALNNEALMARLSRAAKERKIDLVILPDLAERDVVGLRDKMSNLGLSISLPARSSMAASPITAVILMFGLFAGVIFVVVRQFSLSVKVYSIALGIVVLLGLIGIFTFENEIRLALAWLAAVSAPIMGYLLLKDRMSTLKGLRGSAAWLLGMTTSSLIGALIAAALLSTETYLLGIESFRGVKAALVTPLVVIGGIAILENLKSGLRWYDMIVLVLIGIVISIMLLRSGNGAVGALTASGWEQNIRGQFEELFYARPRFKEFLIGHPALILFGALSILRKTSLGWGLLMLGMIGQVSLINSFLHLHTPLGLTLLRELNALWIGVILGLMGLGLFTLISRVSFVKRWGISTS